MLACILAAALCASCVKENTESCVFYEVRMRVVDNQGNDLTESGVLEKAEVYLFNEEGFVGWCRQEPHRNSLSARTRARG